jgi:guanylate kinase
MTAPAARPLVVILHGPSGVGKESVIEGLRAATGIHRATSTTDRAPRDGEQDGLDYHFITTEEFERRIAAGRFAEHERVYGHWKGLERSEIEGPLAEGRDLVIRTDLKGARFWRAAIEGAVSVILAPAPPDESLEQQRQLTRDRILGREPGISAEDLETRLKELDEELADIPNNDYVVVNHHNGLDGAVDEMVAIVAYERVNPLRPAPRFRAQPATI